MQTLFVHNCILKANKDLVNLFVLSNVFALKEAKATHFIGTHDSRGQVACGEDEGMRQRVLFNGGKFGLICHSGFGRTNWR